jgi:hypothetical protein
MVFQFLPCSLQHHGNPLFMSRQNDIRFRCVLRVNSTKTISHAERVRLRILFRVAPGAAKGRPRRKELLFGPCSTARLNVP